MQVVALVEDQVSVLEPPAATVLGLADSVTVGAGGGVAVVVTATDFASEPPAPVQVSE